MSLAHLGGPITSARAGGFCAGGVAKALFGIGFFTLMAVPQAQAYVPAIEMIPGSVNGTTLPKTPTFSGSKTLGYQFNTMVDQVIDGIGIYDADNNGLQQFHKVGLWLKNWQGIFQLMRQVSFDPNAGTTCTSDGSLWCWLPIPLTPMKKGDYMIGATWDSSVPDVLAFNTPPPGPGQSYKTYEQLNFLFPVRSNIDILDTDFGIVCTDPMPLDADMNDICAFPLERVDVDAGGYFSSVVSFYSPVNEVPAPLPVFGAAALFGWKRKIRQRLQGHVS